MGMMIIIKTQVAILYYLVQGKKRQINRLIDTCKTISKHIKFVIQTDQMPTAQHEVMPTFRTLVAHQHKKSGWTKLEQKTILPRYAEVIINSSLKVILLEK